MEDKQETTAFDAKSVGDEGAAEDSMAMSTNQEAAEADAPPPKTPSRLDELRARTQHLRLSSQEKLQKSRKMMFHGGGDATADGDGSNNNSMSRFPPIDDSIPLEAKHLSFSNAGAGDIMVDGESSARFSLGSVPQHEQILIDENHTLKLQLEQTRTAVTELRKELAERRDELESKWCDPDIMLKNEALTDRILDLEAVNAQLKEQLLGDAKPQKEADLITKLTQELQEAISREASLQQELDYQQQQPSLSVVSDDAARIRKLNEILSTQVEELQQRILKSETLNKSLHVRIEDLSATPKDSPSGVGVNGSVDTPMETTTIGEDTSDSPTREKPAPMQTTGEQKKSEDDGLDTSLYVSLNSEIKTLQAQVTSNITNTDNQISELNVFRSFRQQEDDDEISVVSANTGVSSTIRHSMSDADKRAMSSVLQQLAKMKTQYAKQEMKLGKLSEKVESETTKVLEENKALIAQIETLASTNNDNFLPIECSETTEAVADRSIEQTISKEASLSGENEQPRSMESLETANSELEPLIALRSTERGKTGVDEEKQLQRQIQLLEDELVLAHTKIQELENRILDSSVVSSLVTGNTETKKNTFPKVAERDKVNEPLRSRIVDLESRNQEFAFLMEKLLLDMESSKLMEEIGDQIQTTALSQLVEATLRRSSLEAELDDSLARIGMMTAEGNEREDLLALTEEELDNARLVSVWKQLEDARSTNLSLTDEIEDLRLKVGTLEATNQQLETNAVNSESVDLLTELAESSLRVSSLEAELVQAEERLDDNEAELEKAYTTNMEMTKQIGTLVSKVGSLQFTNKELVYEIESLSLQTETVELQEMMQCGFSAIISAQLAETSLRSAGLVSELANVKQHLESLSFAVEEKEKKLAVVEKELDDSHQTSTRLREENDALQLKIGLLEGRNQEVVSKLDETKEQFSLAARSADDKEKKLVDIENELNQANSKAEKLSGEIQTLQTKIGSVETANKELVAEVESLALKAETAELEEMMQQSNSTIVSAQLLEASRRSSSLEIELNEKNEKLDRAVLKEERQGRLLQESSNELELARLAIAKLGEEKEAMNSHVAALEKEAAGQLETFGVQTQILESESSQPWRLSGLEKARSVNLFLTEESYQLRETNRDLQSQLGSLQAAHKALVAEVKTMAEATKRESEQKGEIDRLMDEILSLETISKGLIDAKQALIDENSVLMQDNAILRESVESVQREIDSAKSEADQLSSLGKEVEHHKARLQHAESQNKEFEEKAGALAVALDELAESKDRIGALESELQDIEESRNEIVKRNEVLEEKKYMLDASEAKVKALEEEQISFTANVSALNDEIDSLRTALETSRSAENEGLRCIEELKGQVQKLEEEVEDLESIRQREEIELETLKKDYEAQEEELTEKSKQMEERERESEEEFESLKLRLNQSSDELRKDLEECRIDLNATEEELEFLLSEQSVLKDRYDSLEQEKTSLEEETRALREGFNELQSSSDEHAQRATSLEKELSDLKTEYQATKAEKQDLERATEILQQLEAYEAKCEAYEEEAEDVNSTSEDTEKKTMQFRSVICNKEGLQVADKTRSLDFSAFGGEQDSQMKAQGADSNDEEVAQSERHGEFRLLEETLLKTESELDETKSRNKNLAETVNTLESQIESMTGHNQELLVRLESADGHGSSELLPKLKEQLYDSASRESYLLRELATVKASLQQDRHLISCLSTELYDTTSREVELRRELVRELDGQPNKRNIIYVKPRSGDENTTRAQEAERQREGGEHASALRALPDLGNQDLAIEATGSLDRRLPAPPSNLGSDVGGEITRTQSFGSSSQGDLSGEVSNPDDSKLFSNDLTEQLNEELTEQVELLQVRIKELEEGKRKEIKEAKREIASKVNERYNKMKKALTSLTSVLNELTKTNKGLSIRVAELELDLETKEAERQKLKDRVASIEARGHGQTTTRSIVSPRALESAASTLSLDMFVENFREKLCSQTTGETSESPMSDLDYARSINDEMMSKVKELENVIEMLLSEKRIAVIEKEQSQKEVQEYKEALDVAEEKLDRAQVEEARWQAKCDIAEAEVKTAQSSLQAELTACKAELDDEKFCTKAIKDAIVALNGANDKLSTENENLFEELELLRSTENRPDTEWEQESHALAEECRFLRQQKKQFARERVDLELRLKRAEQDKEHMVAEGAQLNERVDVLVKASEELQKTLVRMEERHAKEMKGALEEKKWVEDKLAGAQKSILDVSSKTKSMRANFTSEIDELQEGEKRLTKEVMTLRSSLAECKQEISDLEEDLDYNRQEAKTVVEDLRAREARLNEENIRLTNELKSLLPGKEDSEGENVDRSSSLTEIRRLDGEDESHIGKDDVPGQEVIEQITSLEDTQQGRDEMVEREETTSLKTDMSLWFD